MKTVELSDFKEERLCTYKNEQYCVRDNGCVMRLSKGKRRPLDEKWTFGKVGQHGYLYIGKEGIHRIVATAFHGKPVGVTEELVVDHIDTNRQNNRPENLRWLTREENILNNESTVRKIEYRTGKDIHEVLRDPVALRNLPPSNDTWCRPTAIGEAKNLRARQEIWNRKSKESSNAGENQPTGNSVFSRSIGEWVYEKPAELRQFELLTRPGINPKDRQDEDFYYAMYFPCRPKQEGDNPLDEYLTCLEDDTLFSESDYYSTYFIDAQIDKNGQTLIVLTLGIQRDNPESQDYYIFRIEYIFGGYFYLKPQRFNKETVAIKVFNYLCGNIEFDYDDEDLFEYVHFY